MLLYETHSEEQYNLLSKSWVQEQVWMELWFEPSKKIEHDSQQMQRGKAECEIGQAVSL